LAERVEAFVLGSLPDVRQAFFVSLPAGQAGFLFCKRNEKGEID